VLTERLEAWLRAVPTEPAEWRDAAGISDQFLSLDAAGLRAMREELDAVVERYRRAAGEHPAPGARPVVAYVAGLPRVES
jgi:hypothetical protein